MLCLIALGLTLTQHAPGQQPPAPVIVFGTSSTEIVLPPGVELPPGVTLPGNVTATPADTNSATNAATPEEKRLKELLKLSFDRDGPAILTTMAARLDGGTTTNEVEQFRESVVVGDWAAVGEFLSQLPEDHGQQVYRHLLKELKDTSGARGQRARTGQPGMPDRSGGIVAQNPNQQGPASQRFPSLVAGDIPVLAGIAPHTLTDGDVRELGQLLGRLLSRGDALDPLLPQLEQGVNGLGGTDPDDRRRAAELLLAANRLSEAARFLAPVQEAKAGQDWRALEQHARDLAARGRREGNSELLQQSWEINQFILSSKEAGATNREPALERCLELIPLLADQTGTNWLRESFRSDPSRGLAIFAAVNESVQNDLNNRNTSDRVGNLELQKKAVDLFLGVADADQPHWHAALNLLAQTWMQEATWSKQRYQSSRDQTTPIFDPYGNIISYQSYPQRVSYDSNLIPALDPNKVVTSAPDDAWLAALDESLRLAVLELIAELHLKTDDPDKALPVIETLASVQPKEAGALANSLLRAWATAHNPMNRQPQSPQRIVSSSGGVIYYSSSPSGARAAGISLTRAMQVRNIEELAALLRRLEALPIEELSNDAMLSAFTMAHSPAEVFRISDVELVFGPVNQIDVELLAGVAQAMRERLAQQWRSPRLQQQMKTERSDKQIDAEVLRGYDTLQALTAAGLRRSPDDWKLNLAHAAELFDLAEFQYGQKVDLEIYVEKREEAFDLFEAAAELYAAALPDIAEKEQSPVVYQQWFNANLGASDLAYVTRQQEPETEQLTRIRTAILSLPGDAAGRHLSKFAVDLGQQARSLRPELKPRYLRAGLVIVGDHPEAEEARELVTYYDDLLREIDLVVRLDGDAVVGHDRPFGVFVSLQHTADIEREAGGFARYLRDTKRSSPYYYNPSPQQQQRNFVEDFDRQVREKLVDQLEVRSITFLDEKTESRGCGREGWRETPLAYLLLQAKDGAVDQLPPFQMDLDFMDGAGPVVLPVQSTATLLDARPERGEPRPVHSLELTQVLDDRELADGSLTLEIKAAGKGLVPDLNDLVRTEFAGFELNDIDDLGVTVMQVDTEGDPLAAVTERNWLVRLSTANDNVLPRFQFPRPVRDDVTAVYKRYSDADLVEVEPELALTGLALRPRPWWHWFAVGLPAVVAIGGTVWWLRRRKTPDAMIQQAYTLPEHATPFALISLLRSMSEDASLQWSEPNRSDLLRTIGNLECHYFARESNGDPEPDLHALGRRWVDLAANRK